MLLEAGIAPAAAWGHLAAAVGPEAGERAILLAVARALARGEPGAEALARGLGGPAGHRVAAEEWRQAAAAWEVSEVSGSPLAVCLRSSAEAARSLAQARRETDIALSGPRATSAIVLALPAVGLVLGALLGFESLQVLFLRPIGWVCLACAGGLVALARAWNARLVRRATPPPGVPGLDLELLAVALSAGGSWQAATTLVSGALGRHCGESVLPTPPDAIASLASLSERAGVPGAALLRAEAAERRRDARASAAMAAERLGVTLLLPLGTCVLPAFLLVAVVPLFVALLSSTAWAA